MIKDRGTNMKTVIKLSILALLLTMPAVAQPPESFFPHQVGDRWDYRYWNGGFFTYFSLIITRDSIAADSGHYLFYNDSSNPEYKLDTANNIFWLPNYFNSFIQYKLSADSGEVWENPELGGLRWAWVSSIDSVFVFSQPTVKKQYEYGPVHPDSGPQPYALVKRWLASRFGLIYEWQEPGVFSTLVGCIVAGDTFGILLSVPQIPELPRQYVLKQNYPNPFNPSTTIEFDLPEAALVSIRVYDCLGQHITTLTESKRLAGTHRITWNASGLTSGIYFIRLSTPQGTYTRKTILMR
ncbi:MAG: T9SS type A sorting domain-containing protein [Bacteroidota bacterium]|nr:T9SS type A sorting domain-containing protein [Bacteroidota bacterium]